MALDIEKDIWEPTLKAIKELNQERTCAYCKSYNKGFSTKDNTCNCCGAPGPTKRNNDRGSTMPKAGPGRNTSF
jgi:hypothetical protein